MFIIIQRTNPVFFTGNNKKLDLNRKIEINLAEEGTLIGWYKSYLNNIIWIAFRKSKENICIMALDKLIREKIKNK